MKELENLAIYAARHGIRGRSYKRSSLLKPLDIIFDALDRCPDPKNENELGLVIAGSKGLINDHIRRVTKKIPQSAVYAYVDIFFNEVLTVAHHKNANSLLQHEKLLRSAYLVYMRGEFAKIFVKSGKATDIQTALQKLDQAEVQEHSDEEEPEREDENEGEDINNNEESKQ